MNAIRTAVWEILKALVWTLLLWGIVAAVLGMALVQAWSMGPAKLGLPVLDYSTAEGIIASVMVVVLTLRFALTSPYATAEIERGYGGERTLTISALFWPPRK